MPHRHKHGHPFWEAWQAMGFESNMSPHDMARAWREHMCEFLGRPPEEHWFFGGRRFKTGPWGPQGFNPMVAMCLSKGGGLLPLLVLHLLAQQARYGSEIMTELERRTEGRWLANPGAVYPLLDLLEQQGLVAGEWEDPQKRTRRFYRLTATGQAELAQLKEVLRPKLEEVIVILGKLLADLYAE